MRSRLAPVAAGALAGYVALQWLGRTAGSTGTERRATRPGDDLVSRPLFRTDHATTINAPPDAIWPWLVQMGWHRGGWYTARWVDALLFPANLPAAERIHPEWQHLAVGDHVPDGAPETQTFFVVRALEPARHLVLHSQSHLPPDFRERYRASIDWSWAFFLDEIEPGRTRFHFRTRARLAPWWLAAAYWLVLIPADWIMSRQMLRGLKRRAERWPSKPAERARLSTTAGALALMTVTPLLRPWHRRWGASNAEVEAAMPGDNELQHAHFTATRAITIDAFPSDVWPWLTQVGVGRAGFYSYDLLDNQRHRSSNELLEPWQQPGVGDLAAPMTPRPTTATSFRVAEVDPPRTLVWVKPNSSWAWRLEPLGEGGATRLVTRLKVRYTRDLSGLLSLVLIETADFAMMRRMLLGIRERAERLAANRRDDAGHRSEAHETHADRR